MKRGSAFVFGLAYKFLLRMQRKINAITEKSGFAPLHDFETPAQVCGQGAQPRGEDGRGLAHPRRNGGALAETGTDNIVCAQPFGCLPNHIAGKGTIRTLKRMYEHENIVARRLRPVRDQGQPGEPHQTHARHRKGKYGGEGTGRMMGMREETVTA